MKSRLLLLLICLGGVLAPFVAESIDLNLAGTLQLDCATNRPSASSSTTAKSFDSRTTVEKDVRLSAAPASSTIAIRRFHWISRSIGLMRCQPAPHE